MSSNSPTWKEVAHELGDRLAHHAQCSDHNPPRPTGHGCPFCEDIHAYRMYARKAGIPLDSAEYTDPMPEGYTTISISDLMSSDPDQETP